MSVRILIGDCRDRLKELPDASVHCCVTSPPYFGLRDYGCEGQMGLEPTPDEFVAGMVEVFREVRRVLRDDGTLWLNLGDGYARNPGKGVRFAGKNGIVNDRQTVEENCGPAIAPGFKEKDRLMIPARTAIALQADGWWLRDEIVWHKPRTTPAPIKDRTVSAHEMIYLLAKSKTYYFDYLAIEEPSLFAGETRVKGKVFRRLTEARLNTKNSGQTFEAERTFTVRETRRKRSVWSINPSPYKDAHFATFPADLIEPCVLAGCPIDGTVLDPFGGAGTTALVAERHQRDAILIELNPEYAEIAQRRLGKDGGMFAEVMAA